MILDLNVFEKLDKKFISLCRKYFTENDISDLHNLEKKKHFNVSELKKVYNLAEKFYGEYKFKEAEIIFRAYANLSPVDPRGLGGLIAINLEKNCFFEALELLELYKNYLAIDIDETFLNISYCHLQLKNNDASYGMFFLVKEHKLRDFNLDRYNKIKLELQQLGYSI